MPPEPSPKSAVDPAARAGNVAALAPADFSKVFSALRAILQRHAGRLVVTEDSAGCYRLEGGLHPTHNRPFPIAWVNTGKGYVSFHHMGVYVRPDLLKGASKELKARMQGKACFNFKSVNPGLFAELEQLTVRGFEVFRSPPGKNGYDTGIWQPVAGAGRQASKKKP